MVSYRAIAVDLDHTLLDDTGHISRENLAAIRRAAAAGWHVVIASGRRLDSIQQIAKQLAVPTYAVGLNGAVVLAPDGRQLVASAMLPETVLALFDLAAGTGVNITINSATQTYYFPGNTAMDIPEYIQKAATATVVSSREAIATLTASTPLYKVAFNGPDHALLTRLATQAAPLASAVWSDTTYIELAAPGITKLSGLAAVAAATGVSLAQFVACGDYQNDIAMLAGVGFGVAMANALPEVQAVADLVVANQHFDGVSRVLKTILEKG